MRARGGFTLVELVVAIALSSVVALMARGVYGAVLDAVVSGGSARQALDARVNARRMLSALIGSIDVQSDGAQPFDGRSDVLETSAWSTRTTGWPRLARLRFDAADGLFRLTTDGVTQPLFDGVDSAAFDYLLNPGAAEAWVRRWSSPSSAPVAIRLRVFRGTKADTLLLFVGSRG